MQRTHSLYKTQIDQLIGNAIVDYKTLESARNFLGAFYQDGSISAYGLRMFAAVELEDGNTDRAIELLEDAIEKRSTLDDDLDRDDTPDRFLKGYALARSGNEQNRQKAVEIFDELIGDKGEPGIWTAGYYQARGDVFSMMEKYDQAKAAYLKAAEAVRFEEYEVPYVRLDLACVELDGGNVEEAIKILSEIAPADEYDKTRGQARYLLATLLQGKGRTDEALVALKKSLEEAEDSDRLRAQIDKEDVFAALRESDTFVEAVYGRPPDTTWLDRYPNFAALRDDSRLSELGFRFVDERDAKEGGSHLRDFYHDSLHLGTLWFGDLWPSCQDVVDGLWLIAEGPKIPGQRHTGMDLPFIVSIYGNPKKPDHIWLAPHHEFPALLFTKLPADGATVSRAVHELFIDVPKSVQDFPKIQRSFMGYLDKLGVPSPYSGELEEAGPHELDRHFISSPSVDSMVWGGAYVDDPWPEKMPNVGRLSLVGVAKERRAQRRGSVARFTRRTLFSRSHVTYEIHQPMFQPFYVWEIRYRPNPFPETIERFNKACGTDYPTDLPADVVATIYGFDWLTAAGAQKKLDEVEAEVIPAYLEVLAAIRCNDFKIVDVLRDWVLGEEQKLSTEGRGRIADLCLEYNWRALLEEMALVEPDEKLRDNMIEVLKRPFPETQFSDMGEPANLYGGYDDGGDNGA